MYLPTLPAAARECYKFADKDISEPLVSIRKIVKSGCSVLFEETAVIIKNKVTGEQVLEGRFNKAKNLYTLPLHVTPHKYRRTTGTSRNGPNQSDTAGTSGKGPNQSSTIIL